MIQRFGGKHYQKKKLVQLFPQIDTLVSPFLGGAKVELEFAKQGVQVIANDLDTALVNVWTQFQDHREALLQLLCEQYINISREHLQELKAEYRETGFLNGLNDAAKYIALNFTAYNGIMTRKHVGLPKSRLVTSWKVKYNSSHKTYFNLATLKRWERLEYKPFILSNEDWKSFMNKQDSETYAYLDPPYFGIQGLTYDCDFEEEDHTRLRDYLRNRSNFVLSYNNDKRVIDLYQGEEFRIGYLTYTVYARNIKAEDQHKIKTNDLVITPLNQQV